MEITKVSIWWTIISCIIIWLITASCVTNDRRADDIPGRRDLEIIGQLEAEFDEFDRRIGRIEETAGDIGSEVDRLTKLFAEYTRCVQQLRSTVAEYKSRFTEETEASEKANFDPYDTSDLFRKYSDSNDSSSR